MTSTSAQGTTIDHAAILARPRHRRRRAGRAVGHRRRPAHAAAEHADAALVPQGQPGRLADLLRRHVLADAADLRWSTNTPKSQLAQRLSTIPGVAQVQVFGSQKYAVRIQADPAQLASRGIGIDELQQAVTQRQRQPAGRHSRRQPPEPLPCKANGQLLDCRRLPAADRRLAQRRAGAPGGSGARRSTASRTPRSPPGSTTSAAIMLAIQRQPGANTVETVDAIKRRCCRASRPSCRRRSNCRSTYDRSVSIRDAIHDVQFTLILAGVLVILVILLFLRNLSATIIPSLALPISVIGTFAVMYVLGYSLDNLSLLALTLSVGFVVDDAIVMLENIVRHIEAGETPCEAAIKGAREIGFTIISMTLSLMAVFIPVMFMGGIVGRLLHEFAVTICAAILVSGIVSLTLTPMLCSRYLRHAEHRRARPRVPWPSSASSPPCWPATRNRWPGPWRGRDW